MIPILNFHDKGNELGDIFRHQIYYQDDQEAQEYHLSGVLVEIGYLDGVFAIQTSDY